MFKPPKMSVNKTPDLSVPTMPPSAPITEFTPVSAAEPPQVESTDFFPEIAEEPRAWSPTSEPPEEAPVSENSEAVSETTEVSDIPAEPDPNLTADPIPSGEPAPTDEAAEAPEELIADPENTISEPEPSSNFVPEPPAPTFASAIPPVPAAVPTSSSEDENARYARPTVSVKDPPPETSYTPPPSPTESGPIYPQYDIPSDTAATTQTRAAALAEMDETIKRFLGPDQKVIRVESVSTIPFSDIWYTAEKIAYIRDESTRFALVPFEAEDLEEFYNALEQGYTGQSSYSIRFAGEQYRVERVITLSGPQYNCRKMPGTVPDIYTLGLPKHIVDYLLTLSHESGLILFGGPTGMGKTTSVSALMKKYLEMEGGFMYTIEDPPEMPLDGLYRAANGGLGLCKQCPVDNERWGDGIKSALRSRPRYILVGEIRTPETASQVLRAATSGHLVLSTIHASTAEDALESIIKYASGSGLTESLASDLLARGILGVLHQKLEGVQTLRPVITAAFANPHLTGGDQMRSLIRNQTINLQTLIEAQSSRLFQGRPLFGGEAID